MKVHVPCPACDFKRILDSESSVRSEVLEESDISPGYKPDFYTKCPKGGKTIAIKIKNR